MKKIIYSTNAVLSILLIGFSSLAYSQTVSTGTATSNSGSMGMGASNTGSISSSNTGSISNNNTGSISANNTGSISNNNTGTVSNNTGALSATDSVSPGSRGAISATDSVSSNNSLSNGSNGNRAIGASGTASLGLVSSSDTLPSGASLLSKGQVVSIDKGNRTVRVRDASTGEISSRFISDPQMLQNFNEGDTVQVFSQS